jgi:hypothetical protein
MRVSSTRMTSLFCIEYIAVVAGLDPATHEKRKAAEWAFVSRSAVFFLCITRKAPVRRAIAI